MNKLKGIILSKNTKKVFLITCFLILFGCFNCYSENYNDIVVYTLPAYAEAQAQKFINSINCNGAFYQKYSGHIYINGI